MGAVPPSAAQHNQSERVLVLSTNASPASWPSQLLRCLKINPFVQLAKACPDRIFTKGSIRSLFHELAGRVPPKGGPSGLLATFTPMPEGTGQQSVFHLMKIRCNWPLA